MKKVLFIAFMAIVSLHLQAVVHPDTWHSLQVDFMAIDMNMLFPTEVTHEMRGLTICPMGQDIEITDTIIVKTVSIMGIYNGWYPPAGAYMYSLYLHPNTQDDFPVIQLLLASQDNKGIKDAILAYAILWEADTVSTDAVAYRGTITYESTTTFQEMRINIYSIDVDVVFGTTMYSISWMDMIPFYLTNSQYYFLEHDAEGSSLEIIEELPSSSPAQRYNILGQPVDETYHGIVIQNGQKRVQ